VSRGEEAVKKIQALRDVKGTVETIQMDVTDDDSVDAAAAAVSRSHGRLDILVNCAGIIRLGPPRQAAREIFATNVVGYISVTEAFLPLMRKSAAAGGTPRLVFVSSSTGSITHASDPTSKYYAPAANEYRASNAARNMLMNQYWVKLQQEGFLVFGADPGLTATHFMDPEALRKRGAVEPAVGGERVACVVRGDRDADVGRVCGEYGVSPW
jgi:NAD(P)-dependent dehydrogenase (short-subunit alcohol dehydrogenase family)